MTTLAHILPYLILGLFGLALILFLAAMQQLRQGRNGPYWRLRREAGQRGGQLFLVSVTLFGIALALAFFSGFAAIAVRGIGAVVNPPTEIVPATATPSATMTAPATATTTATPTASPSATSTPTATATASVTFTPTWTATPSLTPTATATFETALNLYMPPNARPAADNAMVRIIAADATVSDNGTPIEPQTRFSAGIERIFLFFSFQDMHNGVAWTRVLYRNGAPLQGSTFLWSLGQEGSSYFFFGNDDGYEAGDYKVVFQLGDLVVSEFEFQITV